MNSGRTKRRIGGVVAVVVALALAGAGLWYWRSKANTPPVLRFSTVPAKVGDLAETVTATGTLSPVDAVELGAEVSGRLTRVLVDVNDRVEAGQVLAEIDPEQLSARVQEARAQLGSAQANVASAKATLAEAELKAARVRALGERELASREEVETAEATLERAKAAVSSANAQITVARAGLSSAETSLQKAIVRAPITGVVLMRAVEPGQTVTAGFQTPVLFTLARDLTSLELEVEVDEADIGKVKQGQAASFVVDAYPDRKFESTLIQLHNMPKAEATVVTYAAVLSVDNRDLLLRPGMTATATIVTRKLAKQLLVENRALRFEPPDLRSAGRKPPSFSPFPGMPSRAAGGPRPNASTPEPAAAEGERVFVEQAPGQLKKVSVSVVASDGLKSAIESKQLKAGDKVVVDVEGDPGS
ncbi:MAG TPA: efflux RND transporter periplasmic adaptor subunit [Polyangiaceae bacterium]|nr:efflux RND transporter periplasmic adaptor subunit [Polyangiaceae bacterium]